MVYCCRSNTYSIETDLAPPQRKNPVIHRASDSSATNTASQITFLRDRLERRYPALFERRPVSDFIALLDEIPNGRAYSYLSPEATAFWQDILDEYGTDALDAYNRVTMLALMGAFEQRAEKYRYTQAVLDEFQANFDRIAGKIARETPGEAGVDPGTRDTFFKDLGLCRQTLFPVGGGVIAEARSRVRWQQVFSGGLRQFFRFSLLLLFVTRGNQPFFRTHMHGDMRADLTQGARVQSDARLAGMLEHNPEIKGWVAQSWFLDPAIETISPHLAYRRAERQPHGAWLFRVGGDRHGHALVRSATRRKLHDQGKYVPTVYMLVWPRKAMIAWSKTQAPELVGRQGDEPS